MTQQDWNIKKLSYRWYEYFLEQGQEKDRRELEELIRICYKLN